MKKIALLSFIGLITTITIGNIYELYDDSSLFNLHKNEKESKPCNCPCDCDALKEENIRWGKRWHALKLKEN